MNTFPANPSASSPAPDLSVIVVVLGPEPNLARCLDALHQQALPGGHPVEIIVPCHDRIPHALPLRDPFPAVRFLPLAGQKSFAALRSAGLLASRAPIVAITEDQCIPPRDWCANILAAHRAHAAAAIGGAVDKQGADSTLNWAIYLRELGVGYMPPIADAPSPHLTDCNVTYKRTALDAIADVWREEFHEPQVHGALRARGGELRLSPALLTLQQRSFRFGAAVAERYDFGRLYGSLRVKDALLARRLLLAVAALLLPFLLTARVVLTAFRKRRHRWQSIRTLPHLLLLSGVWAWGELLGYITAKPPASRMVTA
ncbi:MAG: glycosyltransferase family 2 protein [Candidatus Acidiferrales bacterium]